MRNGLWTWRTDVARRCYRLKGENLHQTVYIVTVCNPRFIIHVPYSRRQYWQGFNLPSGRPKRVLQNLRTGLSRVSLGLKLLLTVPK